jgi:integrase/recombinase XerD
MEILSVNSILKFLNYLEIVRNNKSKTINNRLAAIKSFMEYVSYESPEYSQIVQKIKAIPFRKIERREICYLTKDEIESLLNVCDNSTSKGRYNYLMILLLYNSGMRVSEMITLKKSDIIIYNNNQIYLRIMGKGRKERTVPLWKTTNKHLTQYMVEHEIHNNDYLFSGKNIEHLSRSGVRYRIDCIVKKAKKEYASLNRKIITPHVFRHSTAMSLLQAGVDISTIAIILGHESIETTHKYMVADLKIKENALQKLQKPDFNSKSKRYHVSNDILGFLNSL